MSLANALPAVCNALGGRKFEELAGLKLLERQGPTNGANVYFRFEIGDLGIFGGGSRIIANHQPTVAQHHNLELGSALVLVACVKGKLSRAAPARDLYVSTWFQKVRDLVEASGARWFVLSSHYGLVGPDEVIRPYEYTLNSAGITERREWAERVLAKLEPELARYKRVVMFAGERYREFLVGALGRRGMAVEIPMQGLRRGEQLEWLVSR
jgi:hypothetical protein